VFHNINNVENKSQIVKGQQSDFLYNKFLIDWEKKAGISRNLSSSPLPLFNPCNYYSPKDPTATAKPI
jgi:hypothetical protein